MGLGSETVGPKEKKGFSPRGVKGRQEVSCGPSCRQSPIVMGEQVPCLWVIPQLAASSLSSMWEVER